jgi:transglutaminase-like putative cysteine protease
VQIIQTPEKTLEYAAGNCVDKSVLLASLLEATGHPSQFVALVIKGQQNGQFSHVIVETKNGAKWLPLETILTVPAGWYPPDAEKRYVRKV